MVMKVLQPAELRHIAGTVVVHALQDCSIFDGDLRYQYEVTQYRPEIMLHADAVRFQNVERVEHKKDICSVQVRPPDPGPLSAIFVRYGQTEPRILSEIDNACGAIDRKVIDNERYQIQASAANEHPVQYV
jgi:hypothetical protein